MKQLKEYKIGSKLRVISGGNGCCCANGLVGEVVEREEAISNDDIYHGELREILAHLYIKSEGQYYGLCEGFKVEIIEEKEEPTFKAGDMVEWARPAAFTKLENSWNKKPVYYTGGIAKSGLYICQDEEGKIIYPSHIRKCDPDKVYREMAKEMIGSVPNHSFSGFPGRYIEVKNVEKMLIEAIKKGKEL